MLAMEIVIILLMYCGFTIMILKNKSDFIKRHRCVQFIEGAFLFIGVLYIVYEVGCGFIEGYNAKKDVKEKTYLEP